MLKVVVRDTSLDVDALHDLTRVQQAVAQLEAGIKRNRPDLFFSIDIKDDPDHGCKKIEIHTRASVASRTSTIGHALLSTTDWRKLRELQGAIEALGIPPFLASEAKTEAA